MCALHLCELLFHPGTNFLFGIGHTPIIKASNVVRAFKESNPRLIPTQGKPRSRNTMTCRYRRMVAWQCGVGWIHFSPPGRWKTDASRPSWRSSLPSTGQERRLWRSPATEGKNTSSYLLTWLTGDDSWSFSECQRVVRQVCVPQECESLGTSLSVTGPSIRSSAFINCFLFCSLARVLMATLGCQSICRCQGEVNIRLILICLL